MKRSFDRVAWIYDALAGLVFGGAIRRSQTTLLPLLPKGGRVLIVGGGTGWILLEILERLDPKQVTYIDISAKMIEKTRRKLERKRPQDIEKVQLIIGPLETHSLEGPFDLVVTNFFLDLLPPVQIYESMITLKDRLVSGGHWHFADFQYPDKGIGKGLAHVLIPFMYFFFRQITRISAAHLPPFRELFGKLELREIQDRYAYGKLIRSAIFQKN